jgi:dTMP kinase
MPVPKGKFIAVEGLDGSGKTTVVDRLFEYMKEAGIKVIRTREPGGTPFAEFIRDGVKGYFPGLDNKELNLSSTTLALLMNAARADHLEKVVQPYLARGYMVITDRFLDSTLAYQGGSGGVDLSVLNTLHRLVHGPAYPDVTFLLDGHPSLFASRLEQRGQKDALDVLQTTKAERMREVYLGAYRAKPHAYRLIPADLPEDNVWLHVKAYADALIAEVKMQQEA